MDKVSAYRAHLRALPREEWEPYLLRHSGLPGPRGNLELAQAAVQEDDAAFLDRFLSLDAVQAPVNSPLEFLAFCGVLGLGRRLAAGGRDVLAGLQKWSADPRWRAREAVAMALQLWGDADMPALLEAASGWRSGDLWWRRAVAAGLCEPRLLREPEHASSVLTVLDGITAALLTETDRKGEAFRVLRQGLGYAWSVAVVAAPQEGRALMERWLECRDPDVRWIVKENLIKKRLAKMDQPWVEACRARL